VYLWPQKLNVYIIGGVVLTAVFLGFLDPDLDPLFRGMDPDPQPALDPDQDPSNIKQK
jgi:hypothetical protein